MLPFDWAVDLLFGTLYASAVTLIALVAAIPYGIWQGLKRLAARFRSPQNARDGAGPGRR